MWKSYGVDDLFVVDGDLFVVDGDDEAEEDNGGYSGFGFGPCRWEGEGDIKSHGSVKAMAMADLGSPTKVDAGSHGLKNEINFAEEDRGLGYVGVSDGEG
ncbi:hypothetical protein L1049_014929 [Liquidambar formosana]|uniref:Uncharacterized protein n=1 Tax=Liquidambar formosana TaxID=63359 RepID=A0AAP0S2W1_LIQFO